MLVAFIWWLSVKGSFRIKVKAHCLGLRCCMVIDGCERVLNVTRGYRAIRTWAIRARQSNGGFCEDRFMSSCPARCCLILLQTRPSDFQGAHGHAWRIQSMQRLDHPRLYDSIRSRRARHDHKLSLGFAIVIIVTFLLSNRRRRQLCISTSCSHHRCCRHLPHLISVTLCGRRFFFASISRQRKAGQHSYLLNTTQ